MGFLKKLIIRDIQCQLDAIQKVQEQRKTEVSQLRDQARSEAEAQAWKLARQRAIAVTQVVRDCQAAASKLSDSDDAASYFGVLQAINHQVAQYEIPARDTAAVWKQRILWAAIGGMIGSACLVAVSWWIPVHVAALMWVGLAMLGVSLLCGVGGWLGLTVRQAPRVSQAPREQVGSKLQP